MTATVIPLLLPDAKRVARLARRSERMAIYDAEAVAALARAVRDRETARALADGAMRAVLTLTDDAARAGSLDRPGLLGLRLAVLGARDAADALAELQQTVEALAGEIDHA